MNEPGQLNSLVYHCIEYPNELSDLRLGAIETYLYKNDGKASSRLIDEIENKLPVAWMKIAVYSPNWVGDATLSLPFIHKLKEKNIESEITVVCKDWVAPVYHNNPNIDSIVSYSSNNLKGLFKTIKNGLDLRDKNFDYFYTCLLYTSPSPRD